MTTASTKPYLLKSEVARRYGIRPSAVEKVFPVTVIGGRKRFMVATVQETERAATFAPTLSRLARKLPLQTTFAHAASELRAAGVLK